MKKQLDIKKLLILNLPYLLMGLFATNFGEAWRMAQGADASAKMLSFFSTLPLALAGWIRYLIGVDDNGAPMNVSSDPMLSTLQAALAGVTLGQPDSVDGKLEGILGNASIFGVSLYTAGLADKVTADVKELLAGPGAVRATLKKHLA